MCFSYEALPSRTQHSSYIQIEEWTDHLFCLFHLLQEAPAYGALSCAWGTPESGASILINEHPFRVGNNAHSFLDSEHVSEMSDLIDLAALLALLPVRLRYGVVAGIPSCESCGAE